MTVIYCLNGKKSASQQGRCNEIMRNQPLVMKGGGGVGTREPPEFFKDFIITLSISAPPTPLIVSSSLFARRLNPAVRCGSSPRAHRTWPWLLGSVSVKQRKVKQPLYRSTEVPAGPSSPAGGEALQLWTHQEVCRPAPPAGPGGYCTPPSTHVQEHLSTVNRGFNSEWGWNNQSLLAHVFKKGRFPTETINLLESFSFFQKQNRLCTV